jgi:hypothetical protein
MPIGAASRGPTTAIAAALRVDIKGKLLCVYLLYRILFCNAKYSLYLKGVVDAEGVLLSPAACCPQGDGRSPAGGPSNK